MKHILNNQWRVIVLILACSLAACKKFVEIPPAINQVETQTVFSGDQTALAAVSGVYISMRSTNTVMTNCGAAIYMGLSADEIYNTSSSSSLDPFFTNSLLSNNSVVNGSFWSSSYTTIYKANAITEGLLRSTSITDSLKVQLLGEMNVVRALYYFYLVNVFGDVPLVVSTDYQVNSVKARTSVDDIYQYIVKELIEAQNRLKLQYPSNLKARPNKWTATALLARVYLYQKQWAKAEAEATKVIASNQYALASSSGIANTFLSTSTETIWQVISDVANSADAANFLPSSATVKPLYAFTNSLLGAMEIGDLRKSAWTGKNSISSIDYYYPAKYKNKATSPVTECNIVLRLAELYLIRSECRAWMGDITGAQADLNVIRNRAGLTNSTANDGATLKAEILKERQVELFSEWGHRWLDLKRTGVVDQVVSAVKGANWQSTDALYPIPFAQTEINIYLTQNPGY